MKKMTLNSLRKGDIVRHVVHGEIMMVTANYGSRVTALVTKDLTNPEEWELVAKATHNVIS